MNFKNDFSQESKSVLLKNGVEAEIETYRSDESAIATELLSEGLYEKGHKYSRMRVLYGLYEELGKPNEATFVIARINGEIVAAAAMEKLPEPFEAPLFILSNPTNPQSKIKSVLNKTLLADRLFQVYVKPPFRGLGIAGILADECESEFYFGRTIPDDSVPCLFASGKAFQIASKRMGSIAVLSQEPPYPGLRRELASVSAAYIERASRQDPPKRWNPETSVFEILEVDQTAERTLSKRL